MGRTNALILVVGCCTAWGCASNPGHLDRAEVRLESAPDSVETIELDDSVSVVDVVLFPLNVVPDMVSNTVLLAFNPVASAFTGESVSNIWPIVSLSSPVLGPVCGVLDAAAGYPFWDPIALDESRRYPWSEDETREVSDEEQQGVERFNAQIRSE